MCCSAMSPSTTSSVRSGWLGRIQSIRLLLDDVVVAMMSAMMVVVGLLLHHRLGLLWNLGLSLLLEWCRDRHLKLLLGLLNNIETLFFV